MAIDPGNTRATALDLGALSTRRLKERIGGSDKLDFYKFTLTGSTNFGARLRGLKNNADMRLLSSSGTLLAQNKKPGTQNEAINARLEAGTYYLRVRGGRKETPYRLNLLANAVPNTAPTLSGSLALNALRGSVTASTTAIAPSSLNATDPQQSPDQLIYTITTAPKAGSLFRDGVLLNVGSTFTQADVNNNLISYQQQAIKPIPNSTGITSNVVISGKNAAWVGGLGSEAEVFFYNGTTGITTQLTRDDREDVRLQISGDTVVWETRLPSHSDIRYSINGGAIEAVDTNANLSDSLPQISGQYIVFTRNDLSGMNVPADGVYLFNTGTRTVTQLRSGVQNASQVGVSSTPTGANTVWTRFFSSTIPGQADIEYSIDSSPWIETVNNSESLSDSSPQISGQYIAFRRDDLSGEDVPTDGIYLFNTSTPAIAPIQLQTDTERVSRSRISGNNVVWERDYGGESDVRYSIAGGTARDIAATETFDDLNPYISGTNIAFQRDRLSGDADDGIYLFNASSPSTPPIRLSTLASDRLGGIDGRNVGFVSGSQAFFYDGNTTSDSFGFTVSDGSLTTNGTLNIAIG